MIKPAILFITGLNEGKAVVVHQGQQQHEEPQAEGPSAGRPESGSVGNRGRTQSSTARCCFVGHPQCQGDDVEVLWGPARQRGGLLHPVRHLRLVEHVALADVEIARVLVLAGTRWERMQ